MCMGKIKNIVKEYLDAVMDRKHSGYNPQSKIGRYLFLSDVERAGYKIIISLGLSRSGEKGKIVVYGLDECLNSYTFYPDEGKINLDFRLDLSLLGVSKSNFMVCNCSVILIQKKEKDKLVLGRVEFRPPISLYLASVLKIELDISDRGG